LRRLLVLVMALVASLVVTSPAPAEAAGFDPNDMAFPVGGTDFRITDSFGDCRDGCERSHEGVDIMAAKGVPVYAAGDGIATWVSTDQSHCCRLQIEHGEGWSTRYIHLNNDTEDGNGGFTDDGLGWGIAPGIVDGTSLLKGQLIGWVGDSGNAESTAPHLHFELRQDGVAIDSYGYLHKALGILISQFTDITQSTHRVNIDKIHKAGITKGCNPPSNTLFCPQRSITRGEMAAFISRALGLTAASGSVPFDDVAGNTFEGDIDRIVTAGIGFGCDSDSYCPNRPLLRGEMAEMLVRAFDYDNPEGTDHFVDDGGSQFEESINKLATHDITLGCNPPDNDMFCPDRTLTRGEMASFFARAKDL
jgi:murein DD-endopeptidase MepM/ murein hydrolase activator NlpD